MHRFTSAAAFLALLAASPTVANGDVPDGRTVHGIRCEAAEQVAFHIHQHLAIFDHGRPVQIPPDVGRPLLANCFYWLHTHTPDGIIHVESPAVRQYYLGDFFDVWNQPLSRERVATARVGANDSMRIFVGGVPYSGDPGKIELNQHTDITIEVGPPWKPPVRVTDWQGL